MKKRDSSTVRLYDHLWRKFRLNYLENHPFCVICTKRGRLVAAIELDHIIPHKRNLKLFWDKNNLQGLCKVCHSQKTMNNECIKGFGIDGFPLDLNHEFYRNERKIVE